MRRMAPRVFGWIVGGVFGMAAAVGAGAPSASSPPASAQTATAPASTKPAKSPLVGERVPSEDSQIKDFHSLGMIDGRVTLFRCASPTRDLVKDKPIPDDTAPLQKLADARMKHLTELGIRTIISLENPDSTESGDGKAQQTLWMQLEKQAARNAGIAFISHPMINSGPGSMETMTDADVVKLIDPIAGDVLEQAKSGGVLFHCAAGHDRTGTIAAYIRIKWQHWSAEEAIAEMRRLGHNWVKYSSNGGVSSWHEEHLKGIAENLVKDVQK